MVAGTHTFACRCALLVATAQEVDPAWRNELLRGTLRIAVGQASSATPIDAPCSSRGNPDDQENLTAVKR
jgi:hypothetical protein